MIIAAGEGMARLELAVCGGVVVLCAALVAVAYRRRPRGATVARAGRLSADQAVRVRRVHDWFAGLDRFTFEERLRAFAGVPDPERELATWERMAAAYDRFAASRSLSPEGRKLSTSSSGGRWNRRGRCWTKHSSAPCPARTRSRLCGPCEVGEAIAGGLQPTDQPPKPAS